MKADEADTKTRCDWFWNMYEEYENRVKLNINKPDLVCVLLFVLSLLIK